MRDTRGSPVATWLLRFGLVSEQGLLHFNLNSAIKDDENGADAQEHEGFRIFRKRNPGTARVSTANSEATVILSRCAIFRPATAEFRFKALVAHELPTGGYALTITHILGDLLLQSVTTTESKNNDFLTRCSLLLFVKIK